MESTIEFNFHPIIRSVEILVLIHDPLFFVSMFIIYCIVPARPCPVSLVHSSCISSRFLAFHNEAMILMSYD